VKEIAAMNIKKPISVVLIEDDASACKAFIECANNRTDVEFLGITGVSATGLQYVKDKLPEAVILDLELTWGEGSGLEFLDIMQKTELSVRPIIVVTTRNRSELVQEHLHEYGVEFVFNKKQKGYCPDMVINHLIKLRPYLHSVRRGSMPPGMQTIETPEEQQKRLYQRIDAELNALGFPTVNRKGRALAREAIYMILCRGKDDWDTVFKDLALANNTHYNNIGRPIETAIVETWKNTDVETLEKLYTAPIRKDHGVPTPTEFVHYIADKIRKSM
jgi:DNA-binding NarL/FixJ family response regulator